MATQKIPFRTAYNTHGVKSSLDFSDTVTMTKQSHKDECDINKILDRYQRTGVLEHRVEYEAKYHDISPQDFQESMYIIATAKSMFEDLPSQIRARFKNDPKEFLAFVQDPENKSEMIELGLAEEPEDTPPVQVEVTNHPDPVPDPE